MSSVLDEATMGQVNLGINQFPLSVISQYAVSISLLSGGQENGPNKTAVPQRPSLASLRKKKIFNYLFVAPPPVEWVPRKRGKFFEMLWKYYATNCLLFCGFSYVSQGDVSLSYDVGNIIVYKVHECVNKLNFQIQYFF